MISYIKGSIEDKQEQSLVLDIGNIGLDVHVSAYCLEKMPEKGHEATLLTYLHVREDILQLYGFYNAPERAMFMKMMSISGIGPRQAINILSSMRPSELTTAILNSNIAAIKKAPGVGDKLARRIVLELKDKISEEETKALMGDSPLAEKDDKLQDAVAALTALGYKSSVIQAYFKSHTRPDTISSSENIIKWFLSNNKR